MNELEFPNNAGEAAEVFFRGEWKRGKIVEGYRFRDGIVTIETEDGQRIWCGRDRTDLYRKVRREDEKRREVQNADIN